VKPDLYTRIQSFNAGRDPERLALKYAAMAGDAFGFLHTETNPSAVARVREGLAKTEAEVTNGDRLVD